MSDKMARRIGMRIRSARQVKQWSQEELAERAGIHWSTLLKYEKGRAPIPAVVLRNLELALELTEGGILAGAARDVELHS